MRYFLDTLTVIWYLEDSPHLPVNAKEIIDKNANTILSAPFLFGKQP